MKTKDEPRHAKGRTPIPTPQFHRPAKGPCPGCGSTEKKWCKPWCKALDVMDYR